MSRQYFRELLEPLTLADLAQTTFGAATDTVVWPSATWSAFAANTVRAGQVYKLTAFGVITTTTAGTVTFTPRWGTAVGGTSLGATIALTTTASQTAVPWIIQFWLQVRAIGASGVCVGAGTVETNGITRDGVMGGTTATVDTTAAQGLVVSANFSVASQLMTVKGVLLEAMN